MNKMLAILVSSITLSCHSMEQQITTPDNAPSLPHIQLEGLDGIPMIAKFSPNGGQIVAGSNSNKNNLMLWQNKTGTLQHNLVGHDTEITALQFKHDSTQLASGDNKANIKAWCTKTGKQLCEFIYHKNRISSLDYNSQGLMVSASYGDTHNLALWDGLTGILLNELIGHKASVTMAQFSSDGETIASSNPSYSGGPQLTVFIWNTQGQPLRTFCYHDVNIDLAFSKDLTQFAASRFYRDSKPNGEGLNSILTVWNTQGHNDDQNIEKNIFLGHGFEIAKAQFSPSNKKLISCAYDTVNNLILWDNESGNILYNLITTTPGVTIASFSPNEKYIISRAMPHDNEKDCLLLWNVENGTLAYNLIGHTDEIKSAEFSSDTNYIISSGKELILWFLNQPEKTEEEINTLQDDPYCKIHLIALINCSLFFLAMLL